MGYVNVIFILQRINTQWITKMPFFKENNGSIKAVYIVEGLWFMCCFINIYIYIPMTFERQGRGSF